MKLEFQNKWVRLLIEFLPTLPTIRRYRVLSPAREGSTRRILCRRISDQLRHSEQDAT